MPPYQTPPPSHQDRVTGTDIANVASLALRGVRVRAARYTGLVPPTVDRITVNGQEGAAQLRLSNGQTFHLALVEQRPAVQEVQDAAAL